MAYILFAAMNNNYAETGWTLAFRYIKRAPHREQTMRSMDSTGPLKSFACDLCRATVKSLTTAAPTCEGGTPHNYLKND